MKRIFGLMITLAAAVCVSCNYDVEDKTHTLTIKVKAPLSFANTVQVIPVWNGLWSGNGTYTFTDGGDGFSYIIIPDVYPYTLENVVGWGSAGKVPDGANFPFHFKHTDWAFKIGCTATGNGDNNFLVKLSEKNGAIDKDQTILIDLNYANTIMYDPFPLIGTTTVNDHTFYDVPNTAVYVDGVAQVP